MTQKELLYVEDAVKHECNTISILEDMEKNLNDDEISSFITEEIKKHNTTKKSLMKLLKENSND